MHTHKNNKRNKQTKALEIDKMHKLWSFKKEKQHPLSYVTQHIKRKQCNNKIDLSKQVWNTTTRIKTEPSFLLGQFANDNTALDRKAETTKLWQKQTRKLRDNNTKVNKQTSMGFPSSNAFFLACAFFSLSPCRCFSSCLCVVVV